MTGRVSPPAADPGTPASGLVTLGETMALMSARDVGSFATQRDLKLSVAGAESNVAIGVSRLGAAATWISRLGDDGFGNLIRRELRAEGVNVMAATDPGRPTALMVKERTSALSTRVRYYRSGSAASAITAFDVDAGVIGAGQVLHLTGITPALGAGPASAVELALEIGREAGLLISVDINYRSALWNRAEAGAALEPIVSRADLVFASPEEAALVVAEGTVGKLAQRLADLGPSQVVIKLGAHGAFSLIDDKERTTPIVEVPVVDPVGAGDAFVAGYLAEYMDDQPADQRLATAAAAGAFACTSLGDWEGLPTRVELESLDQADNVQR